MPRTALKTVSSNLPTTPGRQVKYLSEELGKKETENGELKSSICDLTKALDSLQLVKEKVETNNPFEKAAAEEKKSKKKDVNAPSPAVTAYVYFREANKDKESETDNEKTNWRELWKECKGDERQKFVDMAALDKKRFEKENEPYQIKLAEKLSEDKALKMFYEKQKQDLAMEFYEAHINAKNILDEKNKSKKKVKDPDAPKRPLSNYMYFTQDRRAQVVETNPNASVTEVSKILGEEWSKLNKGKGGKKGTKKFDDLAAKDKARYDKEKDVYDALKATRKLTLEQEQEEQLQQDKEEAMKLMNEIREEQLKAAAAEAMDVTEPAPQDKKKKERKAGPKKACSAYIFFSVQNRAQIKASMPGTTTNQELMAEIGKQWKALPDAGKKPYEELAVKDKERYSKEALSLKEANPTL